VPKFYQSFDEFAPKQKYRGSHSVYFHPHDFLHTHRASQLCGGVFRGRVGLRAREMVGERGGEEGGVCALQTGLLCLRCQKRGIEIMPKWTQEKKFDEKKEQKMKVRNCWARDSKKKELKKLSCTNLRPWGHFRLELLEIIIELRLIEKNMFIIRIVAGQNCSLFFWKLFLSFQFTSLLYFLTISIPIFLSSFLCLF